MVKKRINHRVMMIDEDRVLILGGYNEEDKTLNHVEQILLVKENKIGIDLSDLG